MRAPSPTDATLSNQGSNITETGCVGCSEYYDMEAGRQRLWTLEDSTEQLF